MNQEHILDLFFSFKGDLDKINAAIDAKLLDSRTRKISTFEIYIKSRLNANPKRLRMVNMEINPVETMYLSRYPLLAEVEELDLRQNLLGDEGLSALTTSPYLQNLKILDLRNNQITRMGMEILARSTSLPQLEKIDLRSNKMGKRWEEKLKEQERFPNLREVRTV